MSTQVTLSLPDDVAQQAFALAHSTRRDIEDVLSETVANLLRASGAESLDVSALTDEQVLGLARSQMPLSQSRRLAELNSLQSERELTPFELAELSGLLHFYTVGDWIKAKALAEVARRQLQA